MRLRLFGKSHTGEGARALSYQAYGASGLDGPGIPAEASRGIGVGVDTLEGESLATRRSQRRKEVLTHFVGWVAREMGGMSPDELREFSGTLTHLAADVRGTLIGREQKGGE